MVLTRKSSAWLLVALQSLFALLFCWKLCAFPEVSLSDPPTWLSALVAIQFGLALLLAAFANWKYEATALVLLLAVHVVCPLLFFTDLTRNPYFTQIVLLNMWIVFVGLAWLWESWQNGKLLVPRTPLDLPLWSFVGVATLSWIVSYFTHVPSFHESMFWEGIKTWFFLLFNAVAVFYIAASLDEKWRHRFIWTTFWVAGVAAVYGLMQFYGIEQIWQKTLTAFSNRPVSTFGNPNFLSSYLLMVIPLVIGSLMITRKSHTALFSSALLVVLVTGVVATMTRSTWVGTLAALAVLPLAPSVRDFMKKNQKKLGITVAVLALLVLFWPKSQLGGYANPWQRVIEIREVKTKGLYGPWHQRVLIWTCSWLMVKDHPVLGKGWGCFELFYPYYQGRALFHPVLRNFRTHANNAHNEMLEIWSQTGFVGMGIYMWLWFVLVAFGVKCALRFGTEQPAKSLWAWALTASAIGMFMDNFFGNVSIHFAIPAFLFWWQVGLLFSVGRSDNHWPAIAVSEWRILPVENNLHKLLLCGGAFLLAGNGLMNFRKEFQEIYYFRGFKASKAPGMLDQARVELESAWDWFSREVNTDYELANDYSRLSQQSAQMGMGAQAETWRRKALWAYMESLRSNAGYDEIYFNLGAMLMQGGWAEADYAALELQSPRGMPVKETAEEMHGAVYNYSRALAINPISEEGYNFLGAVFLQKKDKYLREGIQLYQQGVFFFPKKRDLWLNLAYLQIQAKEFENAYVSIKNALAIDPFYELTRKNLRALLFQMKKPVSDPLAQADRDLNEVNALIQAHNWPRLRVLGEHLVQIFPESFQMRFLLGNTYTELRLWPLAEEQYLKAREIEPGNLNALNNLGLVYMSTNRAAQARAICEKILEIDPSNEKARAWLQSFK